MATIDRIRRRLRLLYLAFTLKPIAGAQEDPEPDPDPTPDPASDPDPDPTPDPEPKPEDWKSHARKHERRAKDAEKKLAALEAAARAAEDAAKTDGEKAIEKARADAKAEAVAEAQAEIRSERLDAAFARAAAGRVVDIDAARKLLDVDTEDLFTDDGKVDTEALQSAIADLLESKKYLAADPNRPTGDPDAGKGKGGGKSLEDMSVEEHFQRIRRNK